VGWSSAEAPLTPTRSSSPSATTIDLPPAGGGKGRARCGADITIASITLLADADGALYWPEQRLLVVADLHLEKGSSFARRGVLLPPYDTATTLARLAKLIARYLPKVVVALGDNFHDGNGSERMAAPDRAALAELQHDRDWLWIAGNHDPEPMPGITGAFAASLSLGPLTFRHEPLRVDADGEIAGHLHPLACVAQRGRAVRRRCFAADGKRMVMPAFGAYAGGLNIRNRAFAGLFDRAGFTAHMLGERRLYAIAASRCLGD
jgi:DNA ligase-associated metallophosphoesterase